MLGHPDASDELRRCAESKLLRRRLQYLQALAYAPSSSSKEREVLSAEVMEMISGIVLLNIPNEQAWRTYLDTRDVLHMGTRRDPSHVSQLTVARFSQPSTT